MKACQILFVRADAAEQKARFRNRNPYWSAALPVVLEKHGFLSVDDADPDALLDLERLRRHDAVLVARLPDEWWSEEKIDLVFRSNVQVFLEGPLPDVVLKKMAIAGYDPRWKEGTVTVADDSVRSLAQCYGMGVGGSLKAAMPLHFNRRPDGLEWGLADDCPITLRQAASWSLVPWSFAPWRLREGNSRSTEIAELVTEKKETLPVIVRRHGVTASCFDIFSLLAWHHTAEPLGVDTYRVPERIAGVEALLLGIIDDMVRRSGRPRLRVMPWPDGTRWVLNVRHDFDRPISTERMAAVLATHAEAGTRATWYWREGTSQAEAMGMAREAGHEIALHTERVFFGGERERETVERAAAQAVCGATAHGGHTSFRFQGAPNVHWALQNGFDYVELASRRNMHPHFFVWLTEEGLPVKRDIVCLPRHVSVDLGPRDGQAQPEEVVRQSRIYVDSGAFLQVMNHPDINLEALRQVVETLPKEGRADWCARDMALWWRKTHDRDRLRCRVTPGGDDIEVEASESVEGIVFELLFPDGSRRYVPINHLSGRSEGAADPSSKTGGTACVPSLQSADAATSAAAVPDGSVGAAVTGNRAEAWGLVQARMREEIRNYYVSAKADPDSASAKSTIRTNTELVAARGAMLQNFVQVMNGHSGNFLEGKDVFEVGSGFGALGLFFATLGEAKSVTAIDVRSDFTALAQTVADQAGLGSVIRYRAMDMRQVDCFDDACFDVIVCNNSLYYIPTREGVAAALAQFRRLLRKGGVLVIYQANRWRFRDAFTKAPLVHLLPAPLAEFVCRKTGWAHSHGRVEFISPPDLKLRLRKAGFHQVRQCGNRRSKPVAGMRGLFTDFFCTVAQ